jgi:hypothetical protein
MKIVGSDEFDLLSDEDYMVVTTQKARGKVFWEVLSKYSVWFPNSKHTIETRWVKPTKYVAYYKTKGSGGSGVISHIAKNKKGWYDATGYEAMKEKELENMFSDPEIKRTVELWGMGIKRHFVLTEPYEELDRKIEIDPRCARVLNGKRFSKTEWEQVLKAGKWPLR